MELLIHQALYLLISAAFIGFWAISRRPGIIMPSDIFFFGFLTLFSPALLLNPTGESEFAFRTFSARDATGAIELLYAGMLFIGLGYSIAGLLLRHPAAASKPWAQTSRSASAASTARSEDMLIYPCLAFLSVAGLFGLLQINEARDLVLFLTGQLDSEAYNHLRRSVHPGGNVVDQLSEHFRYSIVALFLLTATSYFIQRRRFLTAVAIYLGSFILFAGGLSKQIIIIFVAYPVAALALMRLQRQLSVKYIIWVPLILPLVVISIMGSLYILQYPHLFMGPQWPNAYEHAFYRTFVIPYTDVILYHTIYPDVFPYAGASASSQISSLFGIEFRDVTLEAAAYQYGSNMTSITTVFVASAYAMGGIPMVCLQALIAGSILRINDAIIASLKSPSLRTATYAVLLLNTLLWVQVPLLTAAFSYGIVLVPTLALIMDRIEARRRFNVEGPYAFRSRRHTRARQ